MYIFDCRIVLGIVELVDKHRCIISSCSLVLWWFICVVWEWLGLVGLFLVIVAFTHHRFYRFFKSSSKFMCLVGFAFVMFFLYIIEWVYLLDNGKCLCVFLLKMACILFIKKTLQPNK